MAKTTLTYGRLDRRLRSLGFTALTQEGRARINRHERTGASGILPDAPFPDEVLPYQVMVARHVLREYDLGNLDLEESPPTLDGSGPG
jgi:hypothetical protein